MKDIELKKNISNKSSFFPSKNDTPNLLRFLLSFLGILISGGLLLAFVLLEYFNLLYIISLVTLGVISTIILFLVKIEVVENKSELKTALILSRTMKVRMWKPKYFNDVDDDARSVLWFLIIIVIIIGVITLVVFILWLFWSLFFEVALFITGNERISWIIATLLLLFCCCGVGGGGGAIVNSRND